MPSVKITDKDILKHNHNSNMNKRNSIANSSIRESNESINKINPPNGIVGRSNTTTNASYNRLNIMSNRTRNNSTSHNNIIFNNHNVDINSQEVKSKNNQDSTLIINSNSNSNSVSNTINVIGGLSRRDSHTNESKEPNVRSSQIYTIPKTFLNKDLENTKDSENIEEEEDEADINEDSSGEILYMSFDRKSKKRNDTHTELDDLISEDNIKSNQVHKSPKDVNFDL